MIMTLKEHRRRAYLTTRQLAEKAGVAPGTIWKIEGGRGGEPHITTMQKIAAALGVHPSEIAEFTYEPVPTAATK
jgi:transcriptional regulator with XRE-family HTH domain